MLALKTNYLVQKRNLLNEMRPNGLSLQELRFFSIYLSKINKDQPDETRVVRFSLDEFRNIMDLGRIDILYMKKVTDGLLRKLIHISNLRGGYTGFQLFKECTVDRDLTGKWYVEIDAHDKSLPLMFKYKNQYFSYKLWNALRLKSTNQLRMYEILKQYEKIGSRVISIADLKGMLGLDDNDYPRFNNFKQWVLDVCQQALSENTDIRFTWEPFGKRGKGGKFLYLKFFIEKNDDHKDPITLDQFIEEIPARETTDSADMYDERIQLLSVACNDEFTASQVIVLFNTMVELLPYGTVQDEIECYDYLKRKYDYLNMQSEKKNIPHRFGYLKSIIGKDF